MALLRLPPLHLVLLLLGSSSTPINASVSAVIRTVSPARGHAAGATPPRHGAITRRASSADATSGFRGLVSQEGEGGGVGKTNSSDNRLRRPKQLRRQQRTTGDFLQRGPSGARPFASVLAAESTERLVRPNATYLKETLFANASTVALVTRILQPRAMHQPLASFGVGSALPGGSVAGFTFGRFVPRAGQKDGNMMVNEKRSFLGIPKIYWALATSILAMLIYMVCIPFILTIAKRGSRHFAPRA